MRWFLAVLLLANAVAFYWFVSQPEELDSPVVPVDKNVSQLILLSERAVAEVPTGECVVVGPVTDLALIEPLSAGLTARNVAHQRWSQSAGTDIDSQVYWLQFAVSLESRLPRRFWFELLSQSPDTEISQKSCTAVASTSDFP
ncbi:hypothetical protein QSV34_04365 [Porticoccus sp. W117]|uniref:hypothetical protein n=1 Tax=Porticoccus sp. W117 TaxID=3054777 RepID=UPI002598B480|nr:hypothetical protein [Porticoccus sp. W117]MDM3870583.1 hypothetical protein [Porticoccus sp. W117]